MSFLCTDIYIIKSSTFLLNQKVAKLYMFPHCICRTQNATKISNVLIKLELEKVLGSREDVNV